MATPEGPPTSSTLLRGLWNPDNRESAWQIFVQRYGPLILGWCRRSGLQDADAEEVCAIVQAKLCTGLRRFVRQPGHSFRGWLRMVVKHALIDFRRSQALRPGDRGRGDSNARASLEKVAVTGAVDGLVQEVGERLAQDLQTAERLAREVQQRVEPHTWKAFELTVLHEQPAADVAKQLTMTVAAVYVAKSRVGKMLREQASKLQDGLAEGGQ